MSYRRLTSACEHPKPLFFSSGRPRKACFECIPNTTALKAKKPESYEKQCLWCKKPFTAKRSTQEHCSRECVRRTVDRRKSKTVFGDRAAYLKWCAERRAARPKWRNVRYYRIKAVKKDAVDPFVVFERDGWHCRLCGEPTPRQLRGKRAPNAPELDHVVPLSRGGEHSYANTQLLCRACNGDKRNLLPHEM